jgi:hypothetical protein
VVYLELNRPFSQQLVSGIEGRQGIDDEELPRICRLYIEN